MIFLRRAYHREGLTGKFKGAVIDRESSRGCIAYHCCPNVYF
jgi:hypothetical protein